MPPNDELYLIADELRAIGNMGIRFAENSYDTERYERVRAASARIVAALERRSPDEVLERYDDNLGQVTPQTGSSAAVVREGRILLIRREDNGLWALPGGMAEVGETPSEAAVRELSEEANDQGPGHEAPCVRRFQAVEEPQQDPLLPPCLSGGD